jgi:predicted PurR-regulated permease PerM
MRNVRPVEISKSTIIFTVFFLLSLVVLWQIRDVLLLFFVAYIIMSALAPMVDKTEEHKVPRAVSVVVIFLLSIGIIMTLLFLGITPFVSQTTQLTNQFVAFSDNLTHLPYVGPLIDPNILEQQLGNISQQIINITLGIFQNIFAFISVIIFAIYLSIDRRGEETIIKLFLPKKEKQIKAALSRVQTKLGAWFRGQLLLSVIVGMLYYIALTALGVPYAMSLSILGGIFELVPIIGPIISAIPAVAIGLAESPVKAGVIALVYLFIQQIEGTVIIPMVMKTAVGLNPLLILLAISIGGKLLGIGGVFLAVPIAVVIQILIEEFYLNGKTLPGTPFPHVGKR